VETLWQSRYRFATGTHERRAELGIAVDMTQLRKLQPHAYLKHKTLHLASYHQNKR